MCLAPLFVTMGVVVGGGDGGGWRWW